MLGSGVPQDYLADGTPAQSHPMFRPHPVQGWSPDFVPELVSRAMQDGLVDIVQPVSAHEGLRLARHLARREGILAGISAGATLAAAMRIAETAPAGSRILFMVPDTGERYLSTVLFEDIGQEMDADERAISASTPLCRFGEPPVKAPVAAAPMPLPTPRAMKEVRAAIADLSRPVVIFGLEWCEFTWAAARFLRDIGVPCRQVQLDSAEMLNTSLGGEIRAALRQLTGQPTIPQVFALGRHLGGAMDLMEMHDRGELVPMLEQHGVTVEGDRDVLARGYLPSWLASRSA